MINENDIIFNRKTNDYSIYNVGVHGQLTEEMHEAVKRAVENLQESENYKEWDSYKDYFRAALSSAEEVDHSNFILVENNKTPYALSPKEIKELYNSKTDITPIIIEAINELLVENYFEQSNSVYLREQDVIDRILKKSSKAMNNFKLKDTLQQVVSSYESNGWKEIIYAARKTLRDESSFLFIK